MLDQNTDRMWYVIGAVIVGAAIILILNGTMPQIFASVADTFKGTTDEVTEFVEAIGPTPVEMGGLYLGEVLYWEDGILRYNKDYEYDVSSGFIKVEPGEKYGGNYVAHVYYYDVNKVYIGAISGSASSGKTFVVPGSGTDYHYPNDRGIEDREPAYMRVRYWRYLLNGNPLEDIQLNKIN